MFGIEKRQGISPRWGFEGIRNIETQGYALG
jgi:hypothetical protein